MDEIPRLPERPSEPETKAELDKEVDRMSANLRLQHQQGLLRPRKIGKPPAVTFPSVSRERAFAVASDVAKTTDREVRDVVSMAELTLRGTRTPCVYNVDFSNCWIAYLGPPPGRFGLFSSDIVVVDKTTGAVRYRGSANDEG